MTSPDKVTRVELITVGDELLSGLIVNSNVGRVADALASIGLGLTQVCDVPDDISEIAAAIRSAAARSEVVLISGGLGPTTDDLTREAMAAAAGVPLDHDPALEVALRDRFHYWGIEMPELALRQADVPRGATPLPNARGSAPGLVLELDGARVVALPGVPGELQAMLAAEVLPRLAELVPGPPPITATLRVGLVGESSIAAALTAIQSDPAYADLRFAFLAEGGDVRVRITGAQALVAAATAAVEQRLGSAVYSRAGSGEDPASLDEIVHGLLRERGETVAVAESLTGGLLGAALTDMAGSSASFLGGVIVYATEAKAELGVDPALLAERGPVDAEVAQALARCVRDRFGSTYGLATTGVAGPSAVGAYEPGAVFIAMAGPAGSQVLRRDFPPRRDFVRRLSVLGALDLLRRDLLGHPVEQADAIGISGPRPTA